MTHVATLIASRGAPLPDGIERLAAAILPGAGVAVWLDPGIALDIPFTLKKAASSAGAGVTAAGLRAALLAAVGTAADVAVQEAASRRKRLLLADMDSTMIGQECIDELAGFIDARDRVAAVTERAMRGEIEFAAALRERVAVLEGLPASTIEEVIAQRITLSPGGPELVRTMRRHGAYTCLVSGGFTAFTSRIAAAIGFDEHRGNRLLVRDDGCLAGRVAEPILGREAKLETLRELRARFGLARSETLVVGDGANDLAMIEDAGLGAAFHAKPVVAARAAFTVEYGDLTALLFAQGYRRDEFVE